MYWLLIFGAIAGGALSGFLTYNMQEIRVNLAVNRAIEAENTYNEANSIAKERFAKLITLHELEKQEKASFILNLEKENAKNEENTALLTKQLANKRLYACSANKNIGSSKGRDTSAKEPTVGTETDQFPAKLDELIKRKARECDELELEFRNVWQPWAKNLNNKVEKK